MKRQKEIFLASEGDAWYLRNRASTDMRDWSADPLCRAIDALAGGQRMRILEIGCGEGARLKHLASTAGHEVTGVEPSQAAVEAARQRGVDVQRGTADALPFSAQSFDVVIFGFCLYLCDDDDLLRIAAEADRVLIDPGWLLILDFEAPAPIYKEYHHYAGVWSRKMDYKAAFLWHPAYTLARYEKFSHSTLQWTDETDDWISLSCMRKRRRGGK